jgi:hypothetical protein
MSATCTIPKPTLDRLRAALDAGLEAAAQEHSAAKVAYGELAPLKLRWYAEQVEQIRQAAAELDAAMNPV